MYGIKASRESPTSWMSTCATCARKSTSLFPSSSFIPCAASVTASERQGRSARPRSNEPSIARLPFGSVVHALAERHVCSRRHRHLLRSTAISALEYARFAETPLYGDRTDPVTKSCRYLGQRDRARNQIASGAATQQPIRAVDACARQIDLAVRAAVRRQF